MGSALGEDLGNRLGVGVRFLVGTLASEGIIDITYSGDSGAEGNFLAFEAKGIAGAIVPFMVV